MKNKFHLYFAILLVCLGTYSMGQKDNKTDNKLETQEEAQEGNNEDYNAEEQVNKMREEVERAKEKARINREERQQRELEEQEAESDKNETDLSPLDAAKKKKEENALRLSNAIEMGMSLIEDAEQAMLAAVEELELDRAQIGENQFESKMEQIKLIHRKMEELKDKINTGITIMPGGKRD